MFPLIKLGEIARHLKLTVGHLYNVSIGKKGLHKKNNKELVKFYIGKRIEIDKFIKSLDN